MAPAYRAPAPPPPPRVLVVHPQRAGTSKTFMIGGGIATSALVVASAICAVFEQWFAAALTLFIAASTALFFALGVGSWFLRVVFSLSPSDELTITWFTLGKARNSRVLKAESVRTVRVETDEDGAARIVIEHADGAIPLTTSMTSDPLEPLARRIEDFVRSRGR